MTPAPAAPEPGPSAPRSFWTRWPLVIAIGAVALVVAVAIGLRAGDSATAEGDRRGAEATAYARSLDPILARLTDSAEVTGRALARSGRAADVARVGRTANQQLAVVQEARSRLANRPAPASQRLASGALSRAMQAHQAYLAALARLPAAPPAEASARAGQLRLQGRRVITLYRQFANRLPQARSGITTVGLSDLAGLRQALAERVRAADAERQAELERQRASAASAAAARVAAPSTGSSYAGPVISRVGASDSGSFISVSADYCDRTPGAVNEFVYGFRIQSGGSVVAQDSYVASQTRACNTISMSFSDSFALGVYDVVVTIDNLTNSVSTSSIGSLSVVN